MLLNDSPLALMTREMDRVFDMARPFAATPAFRAQGAPFPPLNAWQDENALHVEAELPGYRLEDVEITAQDETLTIRGQRRIETPEGATALRTERHSGAFERTITLPVTVDLDNVQASLRDGVLHVSLPLTPEVKPRRIQIAG
jgi:HSP20 family protein